MTDDNKLREELTKLRAMKIKATELNKQADEAKRDRDDQERLCLELMEAADNTESLRFNGTLFSAQRDKSFAVIQDRAAFTEWAKANAPDLVREVENKTPLNQLVKAALDDGEELPPGIGFYTKESISMRSS